MLETLFDRFDNIIVLDTETTGFSPRREEIIELAMLRVSRTGETREFDKFIRLSPGRSIPPKIVELTGITGAMLENEGASKEEACTALADMLSLERPLLVAYNAQFDLGFLYYFLNGFGKAGVLKNVRMLDALTVYRDRRPFPHKLCDAVAAYSLVSQNTHRAIDDTKATYELLCAIDAEEPDLHRYINLFGYNAKYGVSGQRISSVSYRPQGYENKTKLYMQP